MTWNRSTRTSTQSGRSKARQASLSRRAGDRSFRACVGVEALEARALLSTIPVYDQYAENAGFGGYLGTDLPKVKNAPTVQVYPMERTEIIGSLPASDPGDVFSVPLQAGQELTLSVAAPGCRGEPDFVGAGELPRGGAGQQLRRVGRP